MKKLKIILTFIIAFNILIFRVDASDTQIGQVVASKGINVRSGPSTNYGDIGGLGNGINFVIYETILSSDTGDTCVDNTWYKIAFKDDYGYVCKYFTIIIENNPTYNYQEQLAIFQKYNGYSNLIEQLHQLHPNWKFYAQEINVDWNTVIDNQYGGKSLIQTDNEGYRSTDSFAYDFSQDVWYGLDGSSWKGAARPVVEYYMDPRNFLMDKSIFAYESLYYNGQVTKGVSHILNKTFLSGTYLDSKSISRNYADTIMDSGIANNVSPYHLASRVRQEVVITRSGYGYPSDSVTGTVSGYIGLYNFFNIGAYSHSGNSAIINGLIYARSKEWFNPYESIIVGASFLKDRYINVGQDTLYYQKYNVGPKVSNKYTHQYMTNIQAPYSEASMTYNAYTESNSIENITSFYIPVYNNMPASTNLPNPGNPNNYLSSLTVNGTSVVDFNGANPKYTLFVPISTNSINVQATALTVTKGATVSGTGNINILSDNQNVSVVVTAANGDKREYIINVIKTENVEMSLNDTIANIKTGIINNGYFSGLTNVDTITETIKKINPIASVKITNLNNEIITSGSIGTGYNVSISANGETKTFETIIYCDTNGDGEITILDLLRVQKQLLGSISLSGAQYKAMDVSKDGIVDILDLLKVQKHLLGSSIINQ